MSRTRTSKEQISLIVKEYVSGKTELEIISSGLYNGTVGRLRTILRNKGVLKSNLEKFKETILPLWLNGMSLCKIQEQFHINKATSAKYLRELGFEVKNTHTELKFNENVFDSIDTEEKAYWLGFIWADGNIYAVKDINDKSQYRFTLSLKLSDKDHLYKFNTFMGHIKDNVKLRSNDKHPNCSWYITNKHLWETLNSYGCTPRKSLTLKFPDKSIFKSEDLIRHFIRGYWDGDGCLSYENNHNCIYPRLSALGTYAFLISCLTYLEVDSKYVREKIGTNIYYELKLNKQDSNKVMHYLYDKCNIFLNRKYNRYLEFCKESPNIETVKLFT